MHILLAILGVVTALALWYHRIRMISSAARGSYRAARGIAGRARKGAPPKPDGTLLGSVTDPRQAAVIMMLQIAGPHGTISDRQDAAIRDEIRAHFGYAEMDAEDLMAKAGWAIRNAPSPQRVMARMSDVVIHSPGIGPKEFDDLCAMLENVAVADGRANTGQRDLIQIWRRKAGLN
ncbi:TerB family tellurite resistance protein [Henriciella marina]|uniref:Co-chaperone DjlA N-terminal domain-containing protein n=1 Tax=Henriciella marina TaxID=453851 RepID=A0ABT4LRB2_9PROT|nr:TerB family tellurite resistance protein [Henriciella marina]MCZ4296851.1 hypothetical protein [Henriciella marina]